MPQAKTTELSAADRAVLRRFRERAEAALPGRVERVVLYGSRARGEAEPDSDWDVAVFLSGPPPGQAETRALVEAGMRAGRDTGHFLHPIAIAADRWDEDTQLLRDIRRYGLRL